MNEYYLHHVNAVGSMVHFLNVDGVVNDALVDNTNEDSDDLDY